MPEGELERAGGGVVRAEDADGTDGPPFKVWAQLLTPGTVTRGGDGSGGRNSEATHWTEDALRDAADKFASSDDRKIHFIDGHPEDPSVRDILGESLSATYDDEYGLVAEGEIDEEKIANLVRNGRVETSPWLLRTHGEYNEQKEAYDAEKVVGVRDIGIVRNGESESTDINLGESPIAREAEDAPTAEALAAAFAPEDDGGDATENGARAHTPTARRDKSDGGEAQAETMAASESEEQPPAGGGGDGGSGDGTGSEAETGESGEGEMPTDPSEMSEEQLVDAVKDLREQVASLKEKNQELRGQVKGLGGDVEELEAAWENVEEGLVEALSDQTGLDNETVEENFDRDGMVEALDADPVAAFKGATGNEYTPDPQTGDPSPSGTNGGQSGGVETLSADEKREVESIEKRIGLFEGREGMDDHVEELESQRDAILDGGGPERRGESR